MAEPTPNRTPRNASGGATPHDPAAGPRTVCETCGGEEAASRLALIVDMLGELHGAVAALRFEADEADDRLASLEDDTRAMLPLAAGVVPLLRELAELRERVSLLEAGR